MNPVPAQREYFLDSIRAWLMLLGIPFHISLIYSSHTWHVNSAEPSLWLTLFNDFIHSFRMQVFFVISGYFSYMLFLRYPLKKWWKVRVERVGIPNNISQARMESRKYSRCAGTGFIYG